MTGRRLWPLLGALLSAGCSSGDHPPAAASSTLDGGSGGDGAPVGDASADVDAVATITPRPDLCQDLSLGGTPIEEMEYATDAIPPIGGAVQQGTYDLEEANQYDGAADAGDVISKLSGKTIQSTIVVTEFELRMLTATGATDADGGTAAPTAQAFLYRTAETSLIGTLVCPTTALPATMGYSASGGGLAIYPDAKHRWLYAKRN